jgi:hypothetical protein
MIKAYLPKLKMAGCDVFLLRSRYEWDEHSIPMFCVGVACEFFDLLQIFAAIPTRKPLLVTERMLVAHSFSNMGCPDRDVGAKCKTYLNMVDDVMSSASSLMDIDMPAECSDFSIDFADELEMKIVSKQMDKVKQPRTFESDEQIALKLPIA